MKKKKPEISKKDENWIYNDWFNTGKPLTHYAALYNTYPGKISNIITKKLKKK